MVFPNTPKKKFFAFERVLWWIGGCYGIKPEGEIEDEKKPQNCGNGNPRYKGRRN
ncbi:MAG: hypothetical protein XD50_0788 [Clostridia bacterium 41_269]|nr:MAG: hypothetical protein XD50_0788 [Clostridia bacterium 41_269]